MKIRELIGSVDLRAYSNVPQSALSEDVANVIACDMMSMVLERGSSSSAWITVQTHPNVVALATFLQLALVIVPCGLWVPDATVQLAGERKVLLCGSDLTTYQLCGRLYALGVGKDAGTRPPEAAGSAEAKTPES